MGASYDPIKLAHAVTCAETACGTDGTAAHRNNMYGILHHGSAVYFKTKADSTKAFIELWNTAYGDVPNIRLASKWVCGGHWPVGKPCPGGDPNHWLGVVLAHYNTDL